MMHGFLVNGVALLWSMCNIDNGKLDGDNTPYWRFEAARDALLSCHPANSFRKLVRSLLEASFSQPLAFRSSSVACWRTWRSC